MNMLKTTENLKKNVIPNQKGKILDRFKDISLLFSKLLIFNSNSMPKKHLN